MKDLLKALEKNNIKGYFVKDAAAAVKTVTGLLKKSDMIGIGGSMTLEQAGILPYLRKNKYKLLDWYGESNADQRAELLHQTFNADVLLTGTNALTEDGKLYNVDGRGNRVAAMIYGPKKVIVVCGRNKIVKNLREAKERVDTIAAPMNAKRLGKKTGCAATGYCMDCHTPDRICCITVITEQQLAKDRMHVIIIDKEYGL